MQISAQQFWAKRRWFVWPKWGKSQHKSRNKLKQLGIKKFKTTSWLFISANGFWTEPLGSNESRPG